MRLIIFFFFCSMREGVAICFPPWAGNHIRDVPGILSHAAARQNFRTMLGNSYNEREFQSTLKRLREIFGKLDVAGVHELCPNTPEGCWLSGPALVQKRTDKQTQRNVITPWPIYVGVKNKEVVVGVKLSEYHHEMGGPVKQIAPFGAGGYKKAYHTIVFNKVNGIFVPQAYVGFELHQKEENKEALVREAAFAQKMYGKVIVTPDGYLAPHAGSELSPYTACDKSELAKNLQKSIETLHEYGVVHNDLKHENILVSKDCVVTIIDPGMASNRIADKMKDLKIMLQNPSFKKKLLSNIMFGGTTGYMHSKVPELSEAIRTMKENKQKIGLKPHEEVKLHDTIDELTFYFVSRCNDFWAARQIYKEMGWAVEEGAFFDAECDGLLRSQPGNTMKEKTLKSHPAPKRPAWKP